MFLLFFCTLAIIVEFYLSRIREDAMPETLKEPEKNKMLMNVREVAEYLRISEAKVYRLANQGGIPVMRIGKAWRFRKDLLDQWIRQNTEASVDGFDRNVAI